MPGAIRDKNRCILRIGVAEKAQLMRAASLEQIDIEDFILRSALQRADDVICRAEQIVLSDRDTRLWLDLLDHPPKPNDRLVAAAKALPADR
jgi:uncharacterized protein (DUF1778 family)